YSFHSDESKTTKELFYSNMNTSTKWGIALGAGIPGVLIVIGLVGLSVKFIMKRCRSRAWDDIRSLPRTRDSSDNSTQRRQPRISAPDREPLCPTTTTTTTDVVIASGGHISIPMDNDEFTSKPNEHAARMKPEQTLVQIQRDRLNRLKEEEHRTRPMLRLSTGELEIQRAIEQAQREFDESV
ncbi:unnamed protein product, partial [Rotaria magnacalcarata]